MAEQLRLWRVHRLLLLLLEHLGHHGGGRVVPSHHVHHSLLLPHGLHARHDLGELLDVDAGAKRGALDPAVEPAGLDQVTHGARGRPSKGHDALAHHVQPGDQAVGGAIAQQLGVGQDAIAAPQGGGLLDKLERVVFPEGRDELDGGGQLRELRASRARGISRVMVATRCPKPSTPSTNVSDPCVKCD